MTVDSSSVAAVVASYNRKELLEQCLQGLICQTRTVGKIILMDNRSTDGTPEFLAQRGYLNHEAVDYVRLPENVGSAGAFQEGVRRAYEQGHNWFWIMDDDAVPEPDALARIFETQVIHKPETGVLSCLVVGTDGRPDERAKAHWIDMRRFRTTDVFNGQLPAVEAVECNSATFVGMLVKRDVVDRVGFPRGDFFIAYDDIEYLHRICGAGFKAYQVLGSRIVHLNAGLAGNANSGIPSGARRLSPVWRSYYDWRNSMYLMHLHSGRLRYLRAAARFTLYSILYGDHRLQRLSVLVRAVNDARTGRLGHRVLPLG